MATFADRKIEAFVGPRALGAADDLEAEIVRFIDAAEDSVDVAVQELDSAPIAEALIRKRLARKSVRLVLNHSYLMEDEPPPMAPASTGGPGMRPTTRSTATSSPHSPAARSRSGSTSTTPISFIRSSSSGTFGCARTGGGRRAGTPRS